MSFAWIFSIIVGAVIIFLALYAASRLAQTERYAGDSAAAGQLNVLLQPLTTAGETDSKPGNISFPGAARILPYCTIEGTFGKQEIRVATRSGVGTPWQEAGAAASSSEKYLFAEKSVEGTSFYTLVRPLNLPFKMGDVIALWSARYCFVNPPREISDDIEELHLDASNFIIAASSSACPAGSTTVCFLGASGGTCAVSVDTAGQRVIKQRQTLFYEPALFYAAIVSDPALYECQVQRMLKRGATLAVLYREKSEFIAARSHTGCSAILQPALAAYAPLLQNATSRQIPLIHAQAQQIADSNTRLSCPLWRS